MALFKISIIILSIVFLVILNFALSNFINSTKECFRVAVYEHIRINEDLTFGKSFDPVQVLNNNFVIYEKIIKRASYKNSKIIVLPEHGLTSIKSEDDLKKGILVFVPKLKTNPCNNYKEVLKNYTLQYYKNFEEINYLNEHLHKEEDLVYNNVLIRKLSCLASENNIYVAINLLEVERCSQNQTCKLNEKYNIYNTNVVFDNKGQIVAKYQKYHLLGETYTSKPNEIQYVTFDTEYGRFGIAICFDLMFKEPLNGLVTKHKIDHLIFSTNWFDELPLLPGLNYHSAVSVKYGVNILSANSRNFKNGSFGSGIFSSEGVILQTTFDNQDRLLIANLPLGKIRKEKVETNPIDKNESLLEYDNLDIESNQQCNYFEAVPVLEDVYNENSRLFRFNTYLSDYVSLQNNLSEYKYKRIETTSGSIKDVCYDNVCCNLDWKMNDKFNFISDNYYLVALNRLRNSYVRWYEESCALVSYHEYKKEWKLLSSTHFDKLRLSGTFNTIDIFPNVISSAYNIVPKNKWEFNQKGNQAEIRFNQVQKPISFVTLYGRNYLKDEN